MRLGQGVGTRRHPVLMAIAGSGASRVLCGERLGSVFPSEGKDVTSRQDLQVRDSLQFAVCASTYFALCEEVGVEFLPVAAYQSISHKGTLVIRLPSPTCVFRGNPVFQTCVFRVNTTSITRVFRAILLLYTYVFRVYAR